MLIPFPFYSPVSSKVCTSSRGSEKVYLDPQPEVIIFPLSPCRPSALLCGAHHDSGSNHCSISSPVLGAAVYPEVIPTQ